MCVVAREASANHFEYFASCTVSGRVRERSRRGLAEIVGLAETGEERIDYWPRIPSGFGELRRGYEPVVLTPLEAVIARELGILRQARLGLALVSRDLARPPHPLRCCVAHSTRIVDRPLVCDTLHGSAGSRPCVAQRPRRGCQPLAGSVLPTASWRHALLWKGKVRRPFSTESRSECSYPYPNR